LLTLNGQEWIDALRFKYHDLKFTRIAVAKDLGDGLNEEQKQ